MWFSDYHLEEKLMDLRVQEERRQAELRRLEREARRAHQGWLSHQIGSLFVSVGVRLRQAGPPQSRPVGRQSPEIQF